METEQIALLRKPFETQAIGKLPKIYCGKCREAAKSNSACPDHKRSKCVECGNTITNAHLHIDYVGHAYVTERLLEVDPNWYWEPVAFDTNGLPATDANGGMWIRLTVCGQTRLGYGCADGKRGGDAVKETISDAIKNAAMRFGVALDLWKKDKASKVIDAPASAPRTKKQPTPEEAKRAALWRQAVTVANQKGSYPDAKLQEHFKEWSEGTSMRQATEEQLTSYLKEWKQAPPADGGRPDLTVVAGA